MNENVLSSIIWLSMNRVNSDYDKSKEQSISSIILINMRKVNSNIPYKKHNKLND